jgi:RNA polymerase sigma-54 factor
MSYINLPFLVYICYTLPMNLSVIKAQIQKPVFTASLEKSIAILLLPHTELAGSIEQELQNNPLLEADFEGAQVDSEQMNALVSLPSSNMPRSAADEEEQDFESSAMENMMTLEDHLFHQLFWEISDPVKREIGNFIIGNLNREGFLHLTCEEIAETLGISDISIVKEVLNSIQNFDPSGIATMNIKECLIVQLRSRQSPHRDLAIRIVEEYLDCLANKKYTALSKKLSVSLEDINAAESLIASLEPKPARNYRANDPSIYVEPDIFVRKNEEGQYIAETNKSGLPALKISQTYRSLLNEPNISNEDRDFIKEKITNALNFMRSLAQRGDTLTAIARYILNRQKEFFNGEDSTLIPMTLKEVAEHLERCESTISRAISNKYMDTPQGLYPLKFFFSNNASRQKHENVSAHNVKQELAQLIEEENKQAPLSDLEIQAYFNSKGLHLARRTITKYRQTLHIPASHLRK